jgi:hypothetical protein
MGSVRLYGATSGYLELQAPDVSPDSTLVLPSDSLQPGLVHLHTETFTSAGSVALDNIFSTTYGQYRLIVEFSAGGNGYLVARLRSGGATDLAASFYTQELNAGGTSASASQYNAQTLARLGRASSAQINHASVDIFGAAVVGETGMQSIARGDGPGVGAWQSVVRHTASSSYDGIVLYHSASTFSGSVSVYGYRNS